MCLPVYLVQYRTYHVRYMLHMLYYIPCTAHDLKPKQVGKAAMQYITPPLTLDNR